MRRPEDALRSLKRYAAQVLGDDWEVRLSREEDVFQKPYCAVKWAGPGAHAGPAHTTTITRPAILYAYPDTEGLEPDEAFMRAQNVEDLLYVGFRRGVDLGRPGRIPLFDYAGIPLDQSSTSRLAADYLRLNEFSVDTKLDADDPTNHYVVADLRVAWRRSGPVLSDHRPLSSVRQTITEPTQS